MSALSDAICSIANPQDWERAALYDVLRNEMLPAVATCTDDPPTAPTSPATRYVITRVRVTDTAIHCTGYIEAWSELEQAWDTMPFEPLWHKLLYEREVALSTPADVLDEATWERVRIDAEEGVTVAHKLGFRLEATEEFIHAAWGAAQGE